MLYVNLVLTNGKSLDFRCNSVEPSEELVKVAFVFGGVCPRAFNLVDGGTSEMVCEYNNETVTTTLLVGVDSIVSMTVRNVRVRRSRKRNPQEEDAKPIV